MSSRPYNEGSEDVVHYSLEGSGTVGHSKEHHERFEETAVGVEGCFLFISRLDAYIIETLADVKFCEVLGSTELEDKFRDKREREYLFLMVIAFSAQ